MRKLFFAFTMLLLSQISFGQAVSDNAVIPVSITLNSILRLTVTSGGNIQFVVNTIDQYTNGIPTGPQYTTTFSVASSRDFNVTMGAEDATFIGIETGSTALALSNLHYTMGGVGAGAIAGLQPLLPLTGPETIVTTVAGPSATNTYEIQWELGTVAPTLLSQSLDADIYVTNVFLNVAPQ